MQFLNGIGQLPVFQQDQISGGVAFWAHVMGFVSGLVLVVLMNAPSGRASSGGTRSNR